MSSRNVFLIFLASFAAGMFAGMPFVVILVVSIKLCEK